MFGVGGLLGGAQLIVNILYDPRYHSVATYLQWIAISTAPIYLWVIRPFVQAHDEALARVYAATAALQLRELEGAEAELEPILSAQNGSRVSWIGKRMERISEMLSDAPYAGDPVADQLLVRIPAV